MRFLIIAATFLLTACEGWYAVEDYRERFPIVVQRESPVLLVSFLGSGAGLSSEEAGRLDAFLISYLGRNGGPLKIVGQGPAAMERLAAIEHRALAAGIPKSSIQTVLGPTGTPSADLALSFERYLAHVPECGDWTKNTAVDYTNTASSNFGCATQRYIGLTAADAQDLVRARMASGHDTIRMSDQLRKYRYGTATATMQGTAESSTVPGNPAGTMQ